MANVRPVCVADARDVWDLRRCEKVMINTMSIPSVRYENVEKKLSQLTANDHIFVAEVDDKVVGMIGLHVDRGPKRCHTANLGIMVHDDYQGQGIGKALMDEAIVLADRWLNVKRIELGVMTDNQAAIALYKKYDFIIEGTKKFVYFSDGKYRDEYIMARYNMKEDH